MVLKLYDKDPKLSKRNIFKFKNLIFQVVLKKSNFNILGGIYHSISMFYLFSYFCTTIIIVIIY